jgi:hypothetical protein
MVNRIKFTPKNPVELPQTDDHIFQPQIRVVCDAETQVVPDWEDHQDDTEEQELAALYRNRPVLARGHLCSAIWKDIDPEKAYLRPVHSAEYLGQPPFKWLDGEQLAEAERLKFARPDVRTEFVPMYSIPFPNLSLTVSDDNKGLDAESLADVWSPQKIRDIFTPLASKYEKWIETQSVLTKETEVEKTAASTLLNGCRDAHRRLLAGIDLLVSDNDSRLAFCFANKALSVQWRWAHDSALVWRPFQIAFILMSLESIANPASPDRQTCDLLWVPTGAGKTEAYLALAAFTIAYRRRRAQREDGQEKSGAGVSVITRYTLRLLTIQQFRRALSVMTACEYLRVDGYPAESVGWHPSESPNSHGFLWGSTPFSVGLWVGGGVTPNSLQDKWGGTRPLPGALSILGGKAGEGEPAQALNCPACKAILAIPVSGLQIGVHHIHLVVQVRDADAFHVSIPKTKDNYGDLEVSVLPAIRHGKTNYYTLPLEIRSTKSASVYEIENMWSTLRRKLSGAELQPARASRPGYFFRTFRTARGETKNYDFQVFCPNASCPLRKPWAGGSPTTTGVVSGHAERGTLSDGLLPIEIILPFQNNSSYVSERIPIPAFTVDDQVYGKAPTIVVATVDKFARPPYEPRASSLFGNVDSHDPTRGYFRRDGDVDPNRSRIASSSAAVSYLAPPELILQDELHLIDGPLGSLVGIYESAVDFLCRERTKANVKYIASTATVRRASQQVRALFARKLQIFPPQGVISDDRFFVTEPKDSEVHPMDDSSPGRLYVGIAAPGRGPLGPVVRIWARLMQTAWQNRSLSGIDRFWTLTGYFNAVRDLAGVRALYRQDIRERLAAIAGQDARPIKADRCQELSSVTDAIELPAILDILNRSYPEAEDGVLATSMFGTGVDIPRLGLMVVHGQPKTTSAYIQATGRVGRDGGGLVVTFFRATRPRDLNHYEFFVGYHRQLHRFVEPATVYPFAPGVLERAGGPVTVFVLRNMANHTVAWHMDTSASFMATHRASAPEVTRILASFDDRSVAQPLFQASSIGDVRRRLDTKMDLWQHVARLRGPALKYVEYAFSTVPTHPVVLGDSQHVHFRLDVVYPGCPQSLRDVEETLGFET